MKIKSKLILLSIFSFVGMVLIGAFGIYSANDANKATDAVYSVRLPKITMMLKLEHDFTNLRFMSYQLLSREIIADEAEAVRAIQTILEEYRPAIAEAEEMHDKYEASGISSEGKLLWDELAQKWDPWIAYIKREITLAEQFVEKPTPESRIELFEHVRQGQKERASLANDILKVIRLLIDFNNKQAEQTVKKAAATSDMLEVAQYIIMALALALLGFMTFSMQRFVIRPIEEARDTVVRIADEQNLALRVKTQSNDEVGEMLTAFNGMLGKLQESFKVIQHKVNAVSNIATSVSVASDQVVKSSASQSSSTSAMAASVEEMTVSINTVANSAGDAQGMSQHAGETATEGGQIIERTTSRMGEIAGTVTRAAEVIRVLGEESQQISSVVQVIKEVADQTNLLALNAAIEAARAGEQGRGFAVVADEVRKLAERTAQSTGDISTMIGKMQVSAREAVEEMERVVQQVGEGQSLAEEANERIHAIRDGANRVSEAVTEISNALKEQSQASQDIARHVESIAQMTDENNAAAEEAASNVRQLEQLAQDVNTTLNEFKV
ncbi:MAG: methyl-accepting chemotaxis protein [Zoogloeaceae bacterium]|jgi:methyl-accepting chemotaxis protein|nr:methyl-accepting chemotaxis protein [Zoogloeaceae bacterium]